MADPRFFQRTGPITLGDLAQLSEATVFSGSVDDAVEISDVAPLDRAGAQDISFLDNVRYKDQFLATKARACVVSSSMTEIAPEGVALLVSDHPYKSYAKIAQAFYPQETAPEPFIADQAFVDPTAKIGKGAHIEAGAFIGPNVEIGVNCQIGANASVSHALIGDSVRIYPGARIGQDGFGFAIDPAGHVKVPQLGRVIIEDHVEIGANTCIDRGAGPDTVIGAGTWIDNLVQIGHNVKIGKGCVIIAHAGIAGSSVLEDYVVLAAQVGVAGHLRIGMGAQIGAQSGVMRDIPAGQKSIGSPAIPFREKMKQIAAVSKLTKKKNKVKDDE